MVTLTENTIRSGEALVRNLDDINAGVTAALWFYFSDIEDWKLLVCLPGKGQKEAYKFIQRALHKKDEPVDIRIDQIGVINPAAPIIQLLASAISTGPGISGVRFTNSTINGTLIEDAHIYRISVAT